MCPGHHSMARPQVVERRTGLKIWTVAAHIMNSNFGRPTRGGLPRRELGEVLTTPNRKKDVTEHLIRPRISTDPLVQHKQWKCDLRSGTSLLFG